MDKEKLLFLVIKHSVNSGDYVPNYNYKKLVEAVFDATYPVGGQHDHMCPCGRDWETKKQIARQIIKDYVANHLSLEYSEAKALKDCYDWLD